MTDSGWKKIIILAALNLILIVGIVFWSFGWRLWPDYSQNNLIKADVSQLFPVVLGKNHIINSPPPNFYEDRLQYQAKIKPLGFGGQTLSIKKYVAPKKSFKQNNFASNPVQDAAQTLFNSLVAPILPRSLNSKLAAKAEVFVFPPFYVDYLNEMQDLMIKDGALKDRRTFKTNNDVVLFLDDFSDYLISKGVVPKSEESKLHSGIRRALKLLKEEAGQPQSYFNFSPYGRSPEGRPSKISKTDEKPVSQYGLSAFLNNFSIEVNPIKTANAQAGELITSAMGQRAGQFIGGQVGGQISSQLGRFIPGGIANQIGNLVGNQIGTQLGNELGSLFNTPTSAIDQALRLQMEAQFGEVGSLASNGLTSQLGSLYGDALGSQISNLTGSGLASIFQGGSFLSGITNGLVGQLGQFGQQVGQIFSQFNDLSSVFGSVGSSISGLIGGGGGGGGQECFREGGGGGGGGGGASEGGAGSGGGGGGEISSGTVRDLNNSQVGAAGLNVGSESVTAVNTSADITPSFSRGFTQDPSGAHIQDSFTPDQQSYFSSAVNQTQSDLGNNYNNANIYILDGPTYQQTMTGIGNSMNAPPAEINNMVNSHGAFIADEGGPVIYVNGSTLPGPGQSVPGLVDGTASGILAHEVGHLANYNAAGVITQQGLMEGYFGAGYTANTPVAFPSRYSHDSANELSAEIFVANYTTGGSASLISGSSSDVRLMQGYFDFQRSVGIVK